MKKSFLKRAAAMTLAGVMAAGMTACSSGTSTQPAAEATKAQESGSADKGTTADKVTCDQLPRRYGLRSRILFLSV